MSPIIPAWEYAYVSSLRRDFKVGDIVLYKFREGLFFGAICAAEGQTVSVNELTIYVDGIASNCGIPNFVRQIPLAMDSLTIPPGSYFIAKPNGVDSATLSKPFAKEDISGNELFKVSDMPLASLIKLFYILMDSI